MSTIHVIVGALTDPDFIELLGLVFAIALAIAKHRAARRADLLVGDLNDALKATVTGLELASRADPTNTGLMRAKQLTKAAAEQMNVETPVMAPMVQGLSEAIGRVWGAASAGTRTQVQIGDANAKAAVVREVINSAEWQAPPPKTAPRTAVRVATVAKSAPILLLLCLPLAFSTGCTALLERTLRPNNSLEGVQDFQTLPSIFKAARGKSTATVKGGDLVTLTHKESSTPLLDPEGKPYLDGDGKPIIVTSREEYSLPAPPLRTRFSADSEFVKSKTTASLSNTGDGGLIDFGQQADVSEKAYAEGVEGQVARGETAAAIVATAVGGLKDIAIAVAPVWLADKREQRQFEADRDARNFEHELALRELELRYPKPEAEQAP